MLQGKRQLQARLTAIGKTEVMLRRIQIRGVREAKLLVHRRTGNLGRSIRVGEVDDHHATIVAGGQREVGYAAAEELGSRAFDIVPKKKKALAWGGGRTLGGRLRSGQTATHFAKRVHRRARKGHPFLRPGLQKAAEMEGTDAIVQIWNGAA